MIAVDMPAALRQLIDARLDNIERALIAQCMTRGDRQQILSAVEDQILEMLGQTASDEPTRDDVLSVLAKLDPPEAYSEASDTRLAELSTPNPTMSRTAPPVARLSNVNQGVNVLAVVGFVLACLAFVGAFSWWILDVFGLIALAALTSAAGICGTIALCQFTQPLSSRRGLWMAVVSCNCAPVIAILSFAAYLILFA